VLGAVLAAALSTGGLALLAGSAQASITGATVGAVIPPSGTYYPPTLSAGASSGQAAGDLQVTGIPIINGYDPGDTIELTVGPGSGTNCSTGSDFVGFANAPSVSISSPLPAGASTPTFTTKIQPDTGTATGPCEALGVNDTLVITFTSSQSNTTTTSIPAGATFSLLISGVSYKVGSTTPAGFVSLSTANSSPGVNLAASPANTNAFISDVTVTANTPPTAVVAGSNSDDEVIPNITLTEAAPGTLGVGTVCLTMVSPSGSQPTFVDNPVAPPAPQLPAATVTASGGGISVDSTLTYGSGPTSVSFAVAAASTGTPAKVTLSGLAIDAPNPVGLIRFDIGTSCGSSALANYEFGYGVVTTSVVSSTQTYGSDRFGTAADLFNSQFDCSGGANTNNDSAIIATGLNYPDALSANYLAGQLHTGVLQVSTDSIPSEVLSALQAGGVSKVFIVGGVDAVSASVASQLASTQAYACGASGPTPVTNSSGSPVYLQVTRIAGNTRYGTSEDVATYPGTTVGTLNVSRTTSAVPTAILATGLNFPDALSAGPMAYSGTHGSNGNGHGFPLILTDPSSFSPEAEAAMHSDGIQQVIVMGGPAAISDTVLTQMESDLGIPATSVFRLYGNDRTGTAAATAEFETATTANLPGFSCGSTCPVGLSYETSSVALARGDNFADALSGGPVAGLAFEPILLAAGPSNLGTYTPAYLAYDAAYLYNTATINVFGGPAAIAPATLTAAENALASAP
jgi:putative cell wall-binding protein